MQRIGTLGAIVLLVTALAAPEAHGAAESCRGAKATIVGTDKADVLEGTEKRDVIVGSGGADVIQSVGGDDVICGGPGRDSISSGAEGDTVYGDDGADIVAGGDGEDRLNGGRGPDRIDGGNDSDYFKAGRDRGNDTYSDSGGDGDVLDYDSRSYVGLRVDLTAGEAEGGVTGTDTLPSCTFETLIGGRGRDTLIGDGCDNEIQAIRPYSYGRSDNIIEGRGGDDVLTSASGNDTVSGGTGNDTLEGSGGNDHLDGGPDGDTVLFVTSCFPCGVFVDLAEGVSRMRDGGFSEGQDTLDNIENVTGFDDEWEDEHGYEPRSGDIIKGDDGPNVINARGGSDRIFGRGGNDTLNSSFGEEDYADGGDGFDVCISAQTTDNCEG